MDSKTDCKVWLESPTGEKIPLGEKCIVGRAKDCQVVVNSEQASRRHAMIYRQGQREFWLVDMGSANGTRLNGRHVSQHRKLSDKDKVEVGSAAFIFRQLEPTVESQVVSAPYTSSAPALATIAAVRNFHCWLLVTDIMGSTAIVQRLPDDEVAKQTGKLMAGWKEIVETHKGGVNKFLGDGFLAYWPDADGVTAEVLGAVKDFMQLQKQSPSPFRLVLHYGLATSGGAPSLGEESLGGKDVYFAFRMEKLAATLGSDVLLSEPAAVRLRTLHKLETQGKHRLAGFDDSFEFFSF